uniref:DDE Tnp4 domain-containing protein n=1 Tax=Sinocyclocheilus anshuiensis TaxID=1608454 RepID=A0A671N003_9TELE
MARLIYRLHDRRAFRRERVMRDRTNPLDIYGDRELIERFRFSRLQHATGQEWTSRAIRRVSLALQSRAQIHVCLPTQEEDKFRRDYGIPGIFGCIDGTHVRIQVPSKNECLFVNRKGFHSINVQVVCDANMKLIDVVARWYGSAHDARILRESALAQSCEEGRHSGIMLCDSGYPLKKWLMTPVMVPRTEQERQSNYRCIGVLKRRFHCLHSEIRMEPERVCTIVCAAAVLHNICTDKSMPLPAEDLGPVEAEVEHIREQVAEEDVAARLIRSNIIRLISL